MSTTQNIELSIFTEVPDEEALDILYSLNQDNTPEVGELGSVNDLSELIRMSTINFYVLKENSVIGFLNADRK